MAEIVPTESVDELDASLDVNQPEPWLYRAQVLLPSGAVTKKVWKFFPFLILGRFLPILDFLSDIGSAGISFKLNIHKHHPKINHSKTILPVHCSVD